jgi:aryl-alcohol dehydrogenase-like predicted oxidoreductase
MYVIKMAFINPLDDKQMEIIMNEKEIREKPFGKIRNVTCVGLGGEGVLRTYGRAKEAEKVISEAIAQKITYFDCARVYADSERYYGAIWGKNPELRKSIFQASKSASRDRRGALKDLAETMERLQTDYLDLWQIHDVRTIEDIRMISGPGGALEAFLEAKDTGKVKAIGVTGHHDPCILTQAVNDWSVDSVMIPVNPVEGVLAKTRPDAFLSSTITAAKEKGVAVIAMKTLGASHYIYPDADITADLLIRYALSQQVTVVIAGCSTPEHIRILADAGRNSTLLSENQKQELERAFEPHVSKLAYYRGVL